jgi:hypothetical protein
MCKNNTMMTIAIEIGRGTAFARIARRAHKQNKNPKSPEDRSDTDPIAENTTTRTITNARDPKLWAIKETARSRLVKCWWLCFSSHPLMKQGEKEERPSNGDKQKEKRDVCMIDLNLSLSFPRPRSSPDIPLLPSPFVPALVEVHPVWTEPRLSSSSLKAKSRDPKRTSG